MPYRETMEIAKDTESSGSRAIYPGDTIYLGACNTFEKINGQIINVTDDQCRRQGFWIVEDSNESYWKGNYKDGDEIGVWKKFDKVGSLLTESEYVKFLNEDYKIREIDYSSGSPNILINKPVLGFYIRYLWLFIALILGPFFSRVFINSMTQLSESFRIIKTE